MLRKALIKILDIVTNSIVIVILFVGVSALIHKQNAAARKQAFWGDGATVKAKEIILESSDGKRLMRFYSNGDETMLSAETSRGTRTVSVSYLVRRFGE